MANSTNSRRPILKKNVEAFVPSPRFLSESPARQPSSGKPTPHISHPGQPLPQHTFSPSPSIRQLRSPVPPPPANLFAGNASAFNVDPGIPFLATVGPSDAGNSDRGSINENESPKRFVGGFVSGLKKALTIKGSRRQSSNYQQPAEDMHSPPTMIRDSGYTAGDRPQDPPAYQPPLRTTSPPQALPQDLPPPTSNPPLNDINEHQNDAAAAAPHDILSLDSMASAVTAAVGYGPDYAKMGRPTPPNSDVSLTTYKIRVQNFVRDLVALPWIANERVTIDYYPAEAERRDKRSSHRPAFVWRSQDYNRADYHLDFESESSSLKKTPHYHVKGPSRRTSHTDIDLDAEFPDQTYTPLPYHPPIHTNLSDTLPLFPPNNGPMSEMSQAYVDAPRSGLHGNPALSKTPPARRNPTLVSSSTPPSTLPLLPPDFGQIPNTYMEDLQKNDVNLSSKTPPARKPSLAQRGDPEPFPRLPSVTDQMRSHSRTRSNGQRPGPRNDDSQTFSSTRRRPASVQSSSNTKGDPFRTAPRPAPVYPGFPDPGIPETPPSNRPPGPGSPSKRSHRSHTPNRHPHHESTEEWDQYRPGYVPFERSENYYGTRYGVGIHGLLPPVTRVPSTTSTALSIKQPQPQYPISNLVTPPSRSGSSARALDA